MNKKLIYIDFFILFIFHFHSVNAKSISGRKDSGLYISLNGGSCMPIGNFKSSTYTGEGGYAMNGYGGDITLEHPLKPGWLGLAFESGYYVNQFNLSPYKTILYSYLDNYPFMHYTFLGATPYQQVTILGGIFFEKTFKKFTLELKGQAGVDVLTTPNVDATEIIGNFDFEWIILPGGSLFINAPQTNAVFIYNAGISARYALTKHISVRVNADYLNRFLNTVGEPSEYYENMPLSQLHLEVGLAYHLN